MWRAICHRFHYSVELLEQRVLARWFAVAYALAGIFVFIRDEFVHPADENQWRIINLIPHLPLAWWLFGGAAILAVWLFESSFRASHQLQGKYGLFDGKPPLAISFDHSNPNRKFWSIEPMRDAEGKQVPGTFWEYRAEIKNLSHRTLTNVKIIIEATGPMPLRPAQSVFDIDRKPVRDLSPQEEALAVIRTWYNPPIVQGLVIGEDIYGPIRVTALADDVPPTVKVFHFNPEKMPAVYE